MGPQDMRSLAAKLRRIARDIEETAIGSSRIEMYRSLAKELNVEAGHLEARAQPLDSKNQS